MAIAAFQSWHHNYLANVHQVITLKQKNNILDISIKNVSVLDAFFSLMIFDNLANDFCNQHMELLKPQL